MSLEVSPDRINRSRLNYTSPILDIEDSFISESAPHWFAGLRLPLPAIPLAQNLRERISAVYPTPLEEIDAYCSEDELLYYHHKDREEETGSIYYSDYLPNAALQQPQVLEHSQEMLDEIQKDPTALQEFLDQLGSEQDRLLVAAVKANRASLIPILIEEGCGKINARDHEGKTLMHLAYENSSREMMEVLLYYGADIHLKDGNGWSVRDFMELRDDTELDDWMCGLEETFKSSNYRFPFERGI